MFLKNVSEDQISQISNYLNAKDISCLSEANKEYQKLLAQKNQENKTKKKFILSGFHHYKKEYYNVLEFYLSNRPFETFLHLLYSGLFHVNSMNIIERAVRNMNYDQFYQIFKFYCDNKIEMNMDFLRFLVNFRHPTSEKLKIKNFLLKYN